MVPVSQHVAALHSSRHRLCSHDLRRTQAAPYVWSICCIPPTGTYIHIYSEMTYYVSSGTLNSTNSTTVNLNVFTTSARKWSLDRVHNSRRPLDRLQCVFALCDPVTLTFWSNINWWVRPHDGLSLWQVWWLYLSHLVLSCEQTDRQTDRRGWMPYWHNRFLASVATVIIQQTICTIQLLGQTSYDRI